MASGWPQHRNLALLYVNILGARDLCQTTHSSGAGGRVPAWACVCTRARAIASHCAQVSEAPCCWLPLAGQKEESSAGALQREAGPAVKMNRITPLPHPRLKGPKRKPGLQASLTWP